jgi:hypothetical protein
LLTYGCENGRWRAGGDGATWSVFNNGGATFSGALAPGTAPAAVLMAGTPPSSNLTRDGLTRWGDGTSSGSYGG